MLVLLLATPASAQTRGVAVQVNEGRALPTADELSAVLNPGDLVRDVLGWHKADPKCDLSVDPSKPIDIPSRSGELYSLVQAAGGKNFVTLAFNNTHCGQRYNGGVKAFPDTDALRDEFAAYAVGVVRQVPALGGLSIWNELNGTYKGGYGNVADKLTHYCLLANKVITEVRKLDVQVPIAIGATVGWDIDAWFIALFGTYGCIGKNDPTIWLDVHPFLTGQSFSHSPDWQLFNTAIQNIRTANISNALVATEWGGPAAVKWTAAHPHGDYIGTFDNKLNVQSPDWAALTWFELQSDKPHPNAGLFDRAGALSAFGTFYIKAYKQ